MKSRKYKYYEIFGPDEQVKPKQSKVDETKEKLTSAHYFIAIAVLFASIIKGIALIQTGN